MERKDDQYPTFKTPVGTLVYPFLQDARDYEGDGKFAFSTSFVLLGEAAALLMKFVDELTEQAMSQFNTKKVVYTPYAPTVDKENGAEVEGSTTFKFKVIASILTKKGKTWDRTPALFLDGGDKPTLPIGSGSTARIAYQTYLWKNPGGVGVTLQPTAVLIKTFVERVDDRNSAAFFDDEEPAPDGEPTPDDNTPAKKGAEF